MAHAFPGLGKEFMPPPDEGSYLFMPTTMTHASISEAIDMLSKQDMAFEAIPETLALILPIALFVMPVLYCWVQEIHLRASRTD